MDDTTLLRVSAAGSFALGIAGIAAPDQVHKLYASGHPNNAEATRYLGLLTGCTGTMSLHLASEDVKQKTKKKALKTLGAVWLVSCGMGVYNSAKGTQKKELGLANSAVMGALGAIMLAQGFKKD